jgi:hypothetical protein
MNKKAQLLTVTTVGCVSSSKFLPCVQVTMDQVLRNREAGGHLIIVTKSGQGELSSREIFVYCRFIVM